MIDDVGVVFRPIVRFLHFFKPVDIHLICGGATRVSRLRRVRAVIEERRGAKRAIAA